MTTALVCTELTGEDGLELREMPPAPLAADATRIAVRASSVNYRDVRRSGSGFRCRTGSTPCARSTSGGRWAK